jgi:hypothetical protein
MPASIFGNEFSSLSCRRELWARSSERSQPATEASQHFSCQFENVLIRRSSFNARGAQPYIMKAGREILPHIPNAAVSVDSPSVRRSPFARRRALQHRGSTMFGGNQESDKALLKAVCKRLERTGTQSRLSATVAHGGVTLRGNLQYENQRMAILKAIQGVSGVRNVIDQLQAPAKNRPAMGQYLAPESASPAEAAATDEGMPPAAAAVASPPSE